MIAVITSSGAYLFDLTDEEADKCAEKDFFDDIAIKACRGWLVTDKSMIYTVMRLGISVCYINLNSMREKTKYTYDYMKIGTSEMVKIWGQLYPVEKRIKGAKK